MGTLSSNPATKADKNLSNVSNSDFATKAAAAGIGGGSTGPIAIGDVTNLQTTLDGKAAASHSHTAANITDFATTVDGRIATPSTQITLPSDPTNAMHAVTKQFAEALGSTGTGANTIARRDGSGNLAAATFQGILVGNVTNGGNNTGQNSIQLNALTAATSAAPVQMPPRQRFQGRVWDTTAAASKTVEAYEDFLPASGATAALGGQLRWRYSINGGTVATAMTLDVLTGTLTPVGPVSTAVVPSDPSHLTNKLYVDRSRFSQFNVKAYGAFGDGNSHPLSGTYATLAAAQVDYPHATALTNEFDWAATQKAINLAGVAGGRVFSPAGWYRFDQELVIPQMVNTDDGWNAVDIAGEGMRNTVWEWPTDLGAGKFAIRPPNQITSYLRSKIQDITFYGPRDLDALNGKPANMDGVAVCHRFLLERVACQWFRAGVNIIGDHSNFYHCEISKNYYGVYWAGDATNRGDHNFVSCDINGNKRANLAVHPLNTIDAAFFMGCHLGFAPYGILAEQDNGANVRSLAALSNTSMIDCSFEAIGNAIYYAEGALTDYNGIVTTYFSQCSGTQDNNYKISANPFTAWIVGNVDRCFFIGGHGMFGSHGTNPGAIFAGKFTNSQFEDFRDLTYLSNTVAFARGDCAGSRFKNGNTSGFISYVYDSNCVYGRVVGHWYESVGAMTAGSMVAGVVINDAPSDAQFGLIATSGVVEVKKTTTAAIAVNSVIQASTTYGSVETATASTRPIVGFAKFGAGSTDATIWMWLQIGHRM